MSNSLGNKVKLTIFGESHGPTIGVVIDGLPAGIRLDEKFIQSELKRRAPGQNKLSTARKEADAYIIESGVFENRTTGAPLCVLLPNSDTHSSDYAILKNKMRPGHADYAAFVKYHGYNDYRGGGHFSGRLTAPLVFAGAVAKLILRAHKIAIGAHIANVGAATDNLFKPTGVPASTLQKLSQQVVPVLKKSAAQAMEAEIVTARAKGDSVGGSIECIIQGLPAGVGDPFFDSLESALAHALFSVPAVKGLEFGKGFAFTKMHGSVANDSMHYVKGKVQAVTNNNGGITGGITNGMPVIFRVAIKPTSSISLPQKTVDVSTKKNTTLVVTGRHDPCIVQRAVPVIESVAAWVALDMLLAK
jgi:chorismate synthase